MSNINFVALDFETATSRRASACEVGLTFVEAGEIKLSDSWFIQPPLNMFDDMSISIHGIKPSDTANAPSFAEQWDKLSACLKGKTVVAHYAPFDMGVIREECQSNRLPYPNFRFVCSCALSRFVVPGMYSYSLEPLCHHFGIETDIYHRAYDDSKMAAKLMLTLCEKAKVDSIDELLEKYRYRYGSFEADLYKPFHRIRDYSNKPNLDQFDREYQADEADFDDENPFYDKEVVFTGTLYRSRQEMMQMLLDIGGRTKDSVTKSTDYLVVGQQDFRVVGDSGMSGKQKKAMQMIEKGHHITVISEADFCEMMGKDLWKPRPKQKKSIFIESLSEEEEEINYRYYILADPTVEESPIFKRMKAEGRI